MASFVNTQILNTKLQTPQLPSDLIPRQKLIKYVNSDIERPLTLVSAGGGFGKSTFVSNWLKTTPYKNGWFSIDENDSDLRIFLIYFVAAIQKEFPNFGQRINIVILSSELPPINVIANSLINDLNELPELFILALDDLHLIDNKDIFKILTHILKFPPKFFHLVLITRIDPPLPLTQLRSKNMVKDIRASHLRITSKEIERFIRYWIKGKNVQRIVNLLENKLDGWITGLRLAMLHISLTPERDKNFEKCLKEANFSAAYFLEEVLEYLDDNLKDFLLKTSILKNFSPELTSHVLAYSDNNSNCKKIIFQFVKKNFFIIQLDSENKWFRYHHLLQSLLRKELTKVFSKEEIITLHQRAMKWYELHSMFEDAFYHALQTGNNETIAAFVEHHMHKPLNVDKWYLLDRWLKKLPENIIDKSIPLLIAKLWMLHHKNNLWLSNDYLQKIDKLKKTNKINNEIELQIQFFKAVLLFFSSQVEESYKLFEYVKDSLSDNKIGMKGITAIYYALVSQMNGKGKKVVQEFEKLLSDDNIPATYRHLLLGGIVYAKLIDGDLFSAEDYSTIIEKFSVTHNDIFVQSWAAYFKGVIHYNYNNLEKAEFYFNKGLDNIYVLNTHAPMDCFAGTLLTLQALGKTKEFDKVYNQMIEFVNERNNPFYKTYSFSLRARLALLNDDLQSAENFMGMADMLFDSGNTLFGIELPRLTNIKLLLAQNTPSKINEAIKNLDEIRKLFEKTRNYSQLIPTLVLQAIAYKKKGNAEKAMNILVAALTKGERGGWISPFVEAGEEIRNLLLEIKSENIFIDYITRILEKYPTAKKARTSYAKLDQLTNRELDVIALLAKRYSNKEIADALFISPSTVKRHTITIYQKLGVNKRREAVAKALEAGII